MSERSPGRGYTYALLALYNVAFIVPLLAVFLAAFFGLGSERLKDCASKHVLPAKLLMAFFFGGLACLMVLLK